jgi:LysM repeat protein
LAATTGDGSGGNPDDVVGLLEGMERFFDAKDNCDENFLFAWHKKTAAGVYLGAALGKPTVASAVRALASRLQTGRSVPNRTIAELCGSGRRPEHVFGIAIGAAGDLATLQSTALAWSHGACATDGNMNLEPAGELKGARVFEVKGAPMVAGGNDNNNRTVGRNSTTASIYSTVRLTPRSWPLHAPGKQMEKRATCRYIQVVSGDSCGTLVARCGISAADFYKYNPAANLCGTLMPEDYVCCSAGDPYKPPTPQPDLDGTCATHLIQNGDTCETLAKRYHVTVSELEAWNRGKTWG